MKKATHADEAHHLEQIPNIGRSIAADLRGVGIMNGAAPQPWWRYTPQRKAML